MALRIGVALSSGGAAGLAHIGVVEELLRARIEIECVAGTSAGAMVGAAFAAGRLDEFRDRVMAWNRRRRVALFDPIWPRNGLLGGRRTRDLLGSCAAEAIENLPLPFAAVATDLDTGQRVALRSGEVGEAIRASIAIPGVFAPVCRLGRLLVDGALVDPLPVGPTRELGAAFVIASSVIGSAGTALTTRCYSDRPAASWRRAIARVLGSAYPQVLPAFDRRVLATDLEEGAAAAKSADGLAAILYKASAVVQTTIAAARLRDEPPDFLIAPAAFDIGLFHVHRAAEAIEAGREATRAALPDLLAAIERAQAPSRASFRWWNVREAAESVAA